jgi:hypothetical protein
MYYCTNLLIIVGKSKITNAHSFIIYDAEAKNIINEEQIEENKSILNVEINRTK